MSEPITCIIPTHNRAAFLRRLLYFISQTNVLTPIVIVDSSHCRVRQENEATVEQMSRTLKIDYRHIDANFVTKCRRVVDTIQTPLVFFCADDDFPIPEGVAACSMFLAEHSDYSVAQGFKVSVCTQKQNKAYLLSGFDVADDDPTRRFCRFADNWFCTFFATFRTSILQRSFQTADNGTDYDRGRIFPEIMLSQMAVLQGRLKHLPIAYNLREEHGLNESTVIPNVVDLAHCIELYNQFREVMASQLAESGATTLDRARTVIDSRYGYLLDGGEGFALRKRTVQNRLTRAFRRQFRRLMDIVRTDQVLQRRRLSMNNPHCESDACQLAFQLILKYPHGISEESTAAA